MPTAPLNEPPNIPTTETQKLNILKTFQYIVFRLLQSLAVGYIFIYYSELSFWTKCDVTKPKLFDTGVFLTWLVYSSIAYLFLWLKDFFQVNTFWSKMLTGAIMGWTVEGIIVATTYESLPFSISWTGLAWHAIITVIIGYYILTKELTNNNSKATVLLSISLGVFLGLWATYWWIDESTPFKLTPQEHFLFFCVITLILQLAYFADNVIRKSIPIFQPTLVEKIICVGLFLLLTIFRMLSIPISAVILPPLMIITFTGLYIHKRRQRDANLNFQQNSSATLKVKNLFLLTIIPVTSTIVYTVFHSINLQIYFNYITFIITTPAGFLLYLISLAKIIFTKNAKSKNNLKDLTA